MKIDLDDLGALSPEERAVVSRRLAELDDLVTTPPSRAIVGAAYLVLVTATIGAVLLIPWTIVLSMSLPRCTRCSVGEERGSVSTSRSVGAC